MPSIKIFWTRNGFHLDLKLQQRAAICYATAVLLANAWTCLGGNQTSLRFGCMPPAVKDYLLLGDEEDEEDMKISSLEENTLR